MALITAPMIPLEPNLGIKSGAQSKAPFATQFLILADDLTGACDASVPFSSRGIPAIVLLDGCAWQRESMPVLALSTETRDVPAATMHGRLSAAIETTAEWRNNGRCLLKKVDSVFRGNTVAEIAALRGLLPEPILAIAPAFPAAGRWMRRGVQYVDNGARSISIDVCESLRRFGIEPVILPAYSSDKEMRGKVSDSIANGEKVLLFDTAVQHDMEEVVEVLGICSENVVWIGAGGLAKALASSLPRQRPCGQPAPRAGVVVFLIGSDHPVTDMQLQTLLVSGTSVSSLPSATSSVVVRRIGRDEPLQRTATFFEKFEPAEIACVFVTGGDTAGHLCKALQVRAIAVEREFAPGVSIGSVLGGPLNGASIITKSGGFGDADLLCRIADAYGRKMGVTK